MGLAIGGARALVHTGVGKQPRCFGRLDLGLLLSGTTKRIAGLWRRRNLIDAMSSWNGHEMNNLAVGVQCLDQVRGGYAFIQTDFDQAFMKGDQGMRVEHEHFRMQRLGNRTISRPCKFEQICALVLGEGPERNKESKKKGNGSSHMGLVRGSTNA